ncbi:hypothetical protein K7X08_026290 [Anisodus acutangulus]|uniref:ABC transmembrane type-1 domain-containing protein n=1 Tax=Anisodus acutangulus TaxID=402998 RepID=A0A9Q1LLK3_9SOLA|nr:hypothetical protein K7X08_026290 [Anisodus acutangulus]
MHHFGNMQWCARLLVWARKYDPVGDLTSRLGADCQQVSHVIGNDLNLILLNVLQGTGALVYLLILSLPLGLCTLTICCALFTIMLLHGQYQKKAAKLIQEYTACANEVAQETFSLMRTVRVYGTEEQELRRYAVWMGKLADITLRQSAAYGYWNFSFNTLSLNSEKHFKYQGAKFWKL